MHCPQCSAPITDPQAVFCPRCGTRLPIPVARPVVPVVPRPQPGSGAAQLSPPPAFGGRPAPENGGWTAVEAPSRRPLKIAIAALVGAAVLAWVMGVTLYLAALPGEISFYIDHEIATQVRGQSGGYADILNQTLNQIFAPTWGWAFVGLLVGAGVGWYLTRQTAR